MMMSSSESRLQVSIAQAILISRREASANDELGCGQTTQMQNYRKRRLNYGKESSTEEKSGKESRPEEKGREEGWGKVTAGFDERITQRSMRRGKRTRRAIQGKYGSEIGGYDRATLLRG